MPITPRCAVLRCAAVRVRVRVVRAVKVPLPTVRQQLLRLRAALGRAPRRPGPKWKPKGKAGQSRPAPTAPSLEHGVIWRVVHFVQIYTNLQLYFF